MREAIQVGVHDVSDVQSEYQGRREPRHTGRKPSALAREKESHEGIFGTIHTIVTGVFVLMANMKQRFYYKGQLYYNKNKSLRWDCTSYPKCKAYVVLDESTVIRENLCHQHGRRILFKSENGTYKVNNTRSTGYFGVFI